MEDYSALVEQVLQVPALADRIKAWESQTDTLNMVTVDWKQRLENSFMYKDFQAQDMFTSSRQAGIFRVQNVKEGPYRMIVVGMCGVYESYNGPQSRKQPFAVNMFDCEPLNMLSKAWTNDLDANNVELVNSVKLNFGSCSQSCRNCKSAYSEMCANNRPIQLDLNQPCIVDLQIFDGQKLSHCFAPQVKSNFRTKFIGILSVELNVRYLYQVKDEPNKERVRISGKASSMIAFPESNLKAMPKLLLSDLPVFASEEPVGEKRKADYSDEEETIDAVPSRELKFAKRDSPAINVVEETINFD